MVLAAYWPMTSCRTCKSELPCLLAATQRTSEGEGIENVFSVLRDHQVKSKLDGTGIGQVLYCQWLRLAGYVFTINS